MSFDNFFHGITTILYGAFNSSSFSGTGFFFFNLEDTNSEVYEKIKPKIYHNNEFRDIKSMWIITNRHVVLPKDRGLERLPDKITFSLRRIEDKNVIWLPIEVSAEQLSDRLFLHRDKNIDVACIKVGDLIMDKTMLIKNLVESKKAQDSSSIILSGLTSYHLPEYEKRQVVVTDDIIVVGYPRGFYDSINKYPIIKSGILASPWHLNYEGKECFLIDCRLFPGSSGSLVISKPSYTKRAEDKLISCDKESFVILGVFSGEPRSEKRHDFENFSIIENNSYNLGMVWKSHLIPDIINNGIKF